MVGLSFNAVVVLVDDVRWTGAAAACITERRWAPCRVGLVWNVVSRMSWLEYGGRALGGLVAVVGATGFVGQQLCARLVAQQVPFRALGRKDCPPSIPRACYRRIPALPASPAELAEALSGVDSVIYLAAKVHAMDGDGPALLPTYRRENVQAVCSLAQVALQAGLRNFVYVSTIKVHGDGTTVAPYKASDPLRPVGAYATSKVEAETALQDLFAGSAAALTVVRPPLVYGPGVGANVERLFRWVARGVPLPFGAVDNRRSLVGVSNLADLLIAASAASVPGAFLVSDGRAVSTAQLVREIAVALGRPARLLPIPEGLLSLGAKALQREDMAQRLLGSLEVDITATLEALEWQPTTTMQAELRRTAEFLVAGSADGGAKKGVGLGQYSH